MSTFQILCVTMNQNDFSKIKQMNIHSNVIFANQTNINKIDYLTFENHIATMISTNTKGVGVNRNIALMYADSDICLLADDDIRYYDNLEKKVIESENLKKDSSNNEEDLIISLKQKINDLENTLVTSNNELELEKNTNKDRYNKYNRIQKQKNLYRNCFIFTIIILILVIFI